MKRRARPITNPDKSRAGRQLNTPVHPELVKRVKVLAIEKDLSIADIVHEILCRAFDRMDLIDKVPDPVKNRVPTKTGAAS